MVRDLKGEGFGGRTTRKPMQPDQNHGLGSRPERRLASFLGPD